MIFIWLFALVPSFASESATSRGDGIPTYAALADDAEFFKKLHACWSAINEAGPMNTYGKTTCAHNWVSPLNLPAKLEHVDQIFEDRVDVYDIRPYRGKVDQTNRHGFNLHTDSCFSMSIPSPTEAKSRFDCARTACDFESVTPQPKPARVIRKQGEANGVVEALRGALQPNGIDQFIRMWLISSEGEKVYHRGGEESRFKRAVCDCRSPGVVDPATLAILTKALRDPPAKYNANDKDKARLASLADQLEACGDALVSRL